MAAVSKEKKPQSPEVGLGVGPLLNAAALARAQNQAPDSIPAMMKPGEFILPPDTVHALGGKAVLQHAVNQTHTPGNADVQVPLGFKPELFFANGGAPEDELKKANSFGDAAAATSNAGVTQVSPTPAPAPATASMPKSQQLESNMSMGPPATRKDLGQMQQEWRGVQQAQANERYDAAGAQMAQEARDAATMRQNRAATRPLYGASMPAVSGGEQALASFDAANPNAAPKPAAPAVPPGYGHFNQGEGQAGPPNLSGLGVGPLLNPAPSVPLPAASSSPSLGVGGVLRQGNSYSGTNVAGDITINGAAPRNGGAISAQNDQAATNLAAAGANAQMFRDHAARQGQGPGLGVAPLLAAAGIDSPVIRHSGNDWQSRKDLENAATAASSIMYRPGWQDAGMGRFSRNSGPAATPPAVAAYQAMLQTDQALKQAQPGMDQTAVRENAATGREAMQQQGANQRSLWQRDQEQQRLALDQQTQGIKNRGQSLVERMREQVAAESDPTKRKSLMQHMLDTEGKNQQADPFLVVPGGQGTDAMGNKINHPSSVFDRTNRQFIQQPGQGSQQPVPLPAKEQLAQGQVYQTARGPARWNGNSFDPV